MVRQFGSWYRRKAGGTLDHSELLRKSAQDGEPTDDPEVALFFYLHKKGYSNLELSKYIGVAEGTIRYWLKQYDLIWPEFCCKTSRIGYDSPYLFIQGSLQKGFGPHEMAMTLGVSMDKFKVYMERLNERRNDG